VTVTSPDGTSATASVSVVPVVSVSITASAPFNNCILDGSVAGPHETAKATGGTGTYGYQWNLNGLPGVYSTSATIATSKTWGTNNTYAVIAKDGNSCYNTASVLVNCPRISDATNFGVSFDIYPNPTNGLVNLNITGVVVADASISVVDITGRKVYGNTFHIIPGNEPMMDLSHLPKGLYIISANIEDKSFIKRIVIE
jgi:hypothetical protein